VDDAQERARLADLRLRPKHKAQGMLLAALLLTTGPNQEVVATGCGASTTSTNVTTSLIKELPPTKSQLQTMLLITCLERSLRGGTGGRVW
jgi:hypothetical protein